MAVDFHDSMVRLTKHKDKQLHRLLKVKNPSIELEKQIDDLFKWLNKKGCSKRVNSFSQEIFTPYEY